MKHFKLLDCTLRDGGYYNKWNFEKKNIDSYLKALCDVNIEYIEICFRKFKNNIALGETAFSNERFVNSLKLNKHKKYGVMVNAGDLLFDGKILKNYKLLFPKKTQLKFVRIACHEYEIFKIKKIINFLKKQEYLIFINLMQISEIKLNKLKKILEFLNKTPTDIFYIADSLGCLTPQKTRNLIYEIRKKWKKDIGIHAHDNLGLALKNSIAAINSGANWIDSTVLGMGRGPGNTKTEEILDKLQIDKQKRTKLNEIIKNYFQILKKKYKWGKNIYYSISAKNKIHPTFVQEILSDQRIKQKEKIKALNFLKKIPSRKFNPLLINNFIKFNKMNSNISNNLPDKFLIKHNIIILAGGNISQKEKKKIKELSNKKNYYILSINLNKEINEKFIDMFVFSHPLRIQSQLNLVKTTNCKIVYPFSFLNRKLNNLNSTIKKNLFNFGLTIKNSNQISITKNSCNLPEPLGVGYAISLCIAKGSKNIYMVGANNLKSKEKIDNSSILINKMKKKYTSVNFKSL